MELEYQCSLDDYKEAMYSQIRRPLGSSLGVLWGMILLAIVATTVIRSGWSGLAVFVMLIGFVSLFPFALRVFQKLWVGKDFQKYPGFVGRCHLSVDTESIRTEGELDRRETRWPAFTKYRETENLFILYEGARLLRVFPKRAFGGQQLEEFRELLAANIPARQSK
jgi:hypothetical protein